MACGTAGTKILQKMREGPDWEGVWLCLDPWDVVRLRTASSYWNVLGFFFLIKKEPVALTKVVPFKPFVSAETPKACALIGLHLLAAEEEAGSGGSRSADFGDMWRCGCPRSPA